MFVIICNVSPAAFNTYFAEYVDEASTGNEGFDLEEGDQEAIEAAARAICSHGDGFGKQVALLLVPGLLLKLLGHAHS